MKEFKNLFAVLLAAAFFIGLFIACDRYAENVKSEFSTQISPSLLGGSDASKGSDTLSSVDDLSIEKLVESTVTEYYSSSFVLSAAGDILCQSSQLEGAYNSDADIFDFSAGFANLKSIFTASDLAAATLKTTFAGQYKGASDEYYGYTTSDSLYNSPETLATDIKNAGISLVNTATNHALDSGLDGLISTISYLDQAGLVHVGTAAAENQDSSYTTELNGIKIGFLGYTNSTNDQTLDAAASYALNTLDNYDTTKVDALCSRIQTMKADNEIVVVMLNFGSINSDSIESEQQTLARKLCDAGADMILGTGSRVIKPLEVYSVADNSGKTRNCLILYGMGAIYSSEYYNSDNGLAADIGGIFNIKVMRTGVSDARISSLTFIPIYENWHDGKIIEPVPVCEAKDTSTYASVLDESDMARINDAYEGSVKHLLSNTALTYTYADYAYEIPIQ